MTGFIILAAVGWLASVGGAVLADMSALKGMPDPDDETVLSIETTKPRGAKWALTLTVAGASVGALGTILAVLTES